MTSLLAVVETAEDAAVAIAGGIERLVVRSTDQARLAAVAAVARNRCPVSLWWIGAGATATEVAAALALCNADEAWASLDVVGLPDVPRWAVVVPGNPGPIVTAADRGCTGAVIDGGEGPQRLLQGATVADLEVMRRQIRASNLRLGFSGGMEAPDVPRFLAFGPEILVVDDLLRRDGARSNPVTPERVRLARDLVGAAPKPIVGELLAPDPDHIFVRDWTVSLHLGAYGHERAAQRVRFTVEAEVGRIADRAADMRDVVTYDLITDAIARATVTHVALVETIAEDVAALILTHPRVSGVDVTVEKLDLGPGSLGCRIRRRRAR